MVNITGNIVLNGITDPELVKILEIKIRHEKNLNFNPQQMLAGGRFGVWAKLP